jgi:sugar porter (SP) family MFS transporter
MISVPSFRRDFGYMFENEPVLPADWQTAFNVVGGVGGFCGGFICSWLADRFGRKPAMLAAILLSTGGCLGEVFSITRVDFLMSKLIIGLALGFYLTLGPLVCSEITPVAIRGMATAGINLGIAVGQLISNGVIKAFGTRTDRWAYAGPFAIQLIFTVILLIGLPFAPESPWYHARKNQPEKALKSLQRLWGKDFDAQTKLAALQATIEEEELQKKASLADCFRGTNRLRTGISVGVFACQHLVGIIFVLGYSTYFFQLAGVDQAHSFDLGVGVTACGVAGNITSWFVVERVGRRPIFVGGMAALTLLLLLIGIMDVVPTGAAKWVQASSTVIYAYVYFLTIGAIAFVLLGETSSPSLRARTTALATATQSVFGIAMSFAVPYMVNPDEGNLRGKVGFVFGGLAAIATVGSYLYIPELKGRTFIEIDTLFMRRVPPRKMGDTVLE